MEIVIYISIGAILFIIGLCFYWNKNIKDLQTQVTELNKDIPYVFHYLVIEDLVTGNLFCITKDYYSLEVGYSDEYIKRNYSKEYYRILRSYPTYILVYKYSSTDFDKATKIMLSKLDFLNQVGKPELINPKEPSKSLHSKEK